MTPATTPTSIDLTGLPGPVADSIRRLVESLRTAQHDASGDQTHQRSIIGLYAGEGVSTPSLEEFKDARREISASFPREFPGVGG